jgi:hypothetical protein
MIYNGGRHKRRSYRYFLSINRYIFSGKSKFDKSRAFYCPEKKNLVRLYCISLDNRKEV